MTQPTISEALATAAEHLMAGRLGQAEQLCRQVLAVRAAEPEALRLWGLVALQVGNYGEAERLIRTALQLAPHAAVYHDNLGVVAKAQGRLAEAEGAARIAISLDPSLAPAHYNLALALEAQDRLAEAAEAYRDALRVRPPYPPAAYNLGRLLAREGNVDEAITSYRQAVELDPSHLNAANNLGNLLADQGRIVEAIESFQQALRVNPDFAPALTNFGGVLRDLGRIEEAMEVLHRAVSAAPDMAQAHHNLAGCLAALGQIELAAASYRRALAAHPRLVVALNDLGNVYEVMGRFDDAIDCFNRAIEMAPAFALPFGNLGTTLHGLGRVSEAQEAYEHALRADPESATFHSNALYLLHFVPHVTSRQLCEAHAQWEAAHGAPVRATWQPFGNRREPGRRIRIGLVSGNFRSHPAGYFAVRCLEQIDPAAVELCYYSDSRRCDALTNRFMASASRWRDTWGVDDTPLAEIIRADEVDLLIDLSGHTMGNRLPAFAHRPAPIQAAWIGYMGTTGLGAMDYLIGDRFVVPDGAEQWYSESIVRMPDAFFCFDPPADAPAAGSPPSFSAGHPTFASFSQASKLNEGVISAWSNVLRAIPKARLILKHRALSHPPTRERIQEAFQSHGVEPDRIEVSGWSDRPELLGTYRRVDIALDPFPFSGSTTTLEALWMGVPVITCPGETFASRQSLSYLSTIGLTETIAKDPDEYVEIAVRLASDRDRFAELRRTLRERMASSPLCDGPRFARNFMTAIRAIWRNWCANADENGFLPPEKRPVEIDWGLAEPARAGQDA